MPMAITLVVLLAGSDAATERALGSAARATLGETVSLSVRTVDRVPSDDEAIVLARSVRAEAVATVAWLDGEHQHAALHVYAEATGRWLDRELDFALADAPTEKGRTIGFAIASMLPEARAASAPGAAPAAADAAAASAAAPSPTTLATAAPQPPAVTSSAAPAEAATPAAQAPAAAHAAHTAPVDAPKPASAQAPAPATARVASEKVHNGSVDAALSISAALGGEGSGLGGALGAQLDLSRHFGLRAEVALRAGRIEQLEATSLAVDLGPGVAWRSGDGQAGSPFALALRLGAFARYQDVIRPAGGGREPESHARWLPGIALAAGGLWWFSEDVALVASAGARGLLGKTDLLVQQKPVASLTPLALMLEIGLCAGF